ncbi:MAG: hypothetical protein ACE5MI_13010 [Acidimicrobiia bacterium]
MFEFDDVPLVDELVQTGRFELWWGGSNIKWIALQDRLTGLRAVGRSYVSWNTAFGQAVHEMRRLLADTADH